MINEKRNKKTQSHLSLSESTQNNSTNKRERGQEEAGMEWGERKIKDKFEKTQRLGA